MVIDHWYISAQITANARTVMEEVSISTFKATCLALLDKVKRTGQPILVTRNGEPIAQVLPPPPSEKPTSWLGYLQSTGRIVGDIVSPTVEEGGWESLR